MKKMKIVIAMVGLGLSTLLLAACDEDIEYISHQYHAPTPPVTVYGDPGPGPYGSGPYYRSNHSGVRHHGGNHSGIRHGGPANGGSQSGIRHQGGGSSSGIRPGNGPSAYSQSGVRHGNQPPPAGSRSGIRHGGDDNYPVDGSPVGAPTPPVSVYGN